MASETLSPIQIKEVGPGPASKPAATAEAERPRRRLGAWQTSALFAETGELDRRGRSLTFEPASDPASDALPQGGAVGGLGQRRAARAADVSLTAERSDPIVHEPTRLERLVTKIQTDPNNTEVLQALSEELLDHGLVREARDIQNRLAALQTRTPSFPAPRLTAAEATAPGRVARSRRTTTTLTRPTTSLSDHFPLAELGFTVPLPGESDLAEIPHQIVDQSAQEIAAGQLLAALDSCTMAIEAEPGFSAIHLRIAEIHAALSSAKRAREHAEALIRLAEVSGRRGDLWMVRRVLLHASDSDLEALKQLVDSLIEAGQIDHAIRYGARLIEIHLELDAADAAIVVSERLRQLAPGDARATLEHVVLLARNGSLEQAIACWESATAAGADLAIAKASLAALVAKDDESDHWSMLGHAVASLRSSADPMIAAAYRRTAGALPPAPIHSAGEALLLDALHDDKAEPALLAVSSGPSASRESRALASVAIAREMESANRLNGLRSAIDSLQEPSSLSDATWVALIGAAPKIEELEADLANVLMTENDAPGAVAVLKRAHTRNPSHHEISRQLAEAHALDGHPGAALAILDKLAIDLRAAGELEAMADVLRAMSATAPENLKVKTRLVDSYLQRGFVEDARAELLARAQIEEKSGAVSAAAASLRRAADLSWGLGRHEESYETYRRLIALAPDDAANRSSLVNLLLQEGRIGEASVHQRAVVDISVRAGTPHEAIAALHQVIGLTPDDSTAYYQLGDLLESMGEHRQAEKVFKRLITMDPTDETARRRVSELAASR